MPTLTLTFTEALNVSCQVGDFAYFINPSSTKYTSNNFNSGIPDIAVKENDNNVEYIGVIKTINNPTTTSPTIIIDDVSLSTNYNGDNTQFIFFAKDNKANLSSLLGYYADIKFKNDSKTEAELFTVGTDVFESSK